jgi:hypothetical protein
MDLILVSILDIRRSTIYTGAKHVPLPEQLIVLQYINVEQLHQHPPTLLAAHTLHLGHSASAPR